MTNTATCTGWTVRAQHRDYGRWVRVAITNDALFLTLDRANPLGLTFGVGDTARLPLRPHRRNADMVGMALAACLDAVAAVMGGKGDNTP